MSLEKFKRVAWRLQEMKSIAGVYTNKQIRLAIMEEIGTDERTIDVTIKKMKELGILKAAGFGDMSINSERAQE